ncbi:MAG: rRNA maturation RNase YbeY [Endozoicomonadaceae bacterium]|nr:rRNA maturation RNase YbeY [Endozoicomonadaceae bacterium]MCY4329242.1 rRNA maturation RNase YbeY [Endozoicomonadaceae bacterium]
MSVIIDLLIDSQDCFIPEKKAFKTWVNAAANLSYDTELCIRIVDEKESATLNYHWRKKTGATNVLSFPALLPEGMPQVTLGDIVICAPVVEAEAKMQLKQLTAHWAHMVIHGTLHLLGYDHINEDDALEMETAETQIMCALGFDDPYKNNLASNNSTKINTTHIL